MLFRGLHGAYGYLKTPLTDLTATVGSNSQYFGRCSDMEMAMINCLEAHGYNKGMDSCKDYIADFQECFFRDKQMARYIEIRKVQRKNKDYIPPPRPDCY